MIRIVSANVVGELGAAIVAEAVSHILGGVDTGVPKAATCALTALRESIRTPATCQRRPSIGIGVFKRRATRSL